MILLNPGPVTLSARVRAALQRDDLCHREAEFATLSLGLRTSLETLYDATEHLAVLLTGSGSCAVEAMLATFAPRDAATLVISNGVYGERMALMLDCQGKPFFESRQAWGAALDLTAVSQLLDAHADIACVAVVHHETTTGRLNDLDELAALCSNRNVGLLIDAVSSFGGERIDFHRWRPLAVAATANKCLHGIPGVAFVLGRRDFLATPRGNSPSLYLDLERYVDLQRDGWSPFTQSVQGYYALDEALRELDEQGGWQRRRERYQQITDRLRGVLADLGVRAFLDRQSSASMLTAYHLPPGCSYPELHTGLKQAGFTIYAGQGQLASRVFRIATMGHLGDADVERCCEVFQSLLGQSAI